MARLKLLADWLACPALWLMPISPTLLRSESGAMMAESLPAWGEPDALNRCCAAVLAWAVSVLMTRLRRLAC
ncbi:hypothetical protein [Paludibacterium denitrificans]|uniref:hypothetical protein n=1 Tax=Paludibacterium denitrificans TaxID=2675226 RepID=UPI001E2A9789|nr:hypothetical protein [Paludibacterium denitrificans]